MIQVGGEAFRRSHKSEATFIITSLSSNYGWCCHTPDCAAAQNSRAAAIFPTADTNANKNGIYLQHVAKTAAGREVIDRWLIKD